MLLLTLISDALWKTNEKWNEWWVCSIRMRLPWGSSKDHSAGQRLAGWVWGWGVLAPQICHLSATWLWSICLTNWLDSDCCWSWFPDFGLIMVSLILDGTLIRVLSFLTLVRLFDFSIFDCGPFLRLFKLIQIHIDLDFLISTWLWFAFTFLFLKWLWSICLTKHLWLWFVCLTFKTDYGSSWSCIYNFNLKMAFFSCWICTRIWVL